MIMMLSPFSAFVVLYSIIIIWYGTCMLAFTPILTFDTFGVTQPEIPTAEWLHSATQGPIQNY